MATQKEVKDIKDLGWAHVGVTKSSFSGAVAEFEAENGGKVSVLFVSEAAYVLEDAEGLYGTADLVDGVIKAKGVDQSNPSLISGATVLASYDSLDPDSLVGLDEAELTRLGLNYYEVTESIKNRLQLFKEIQERNSGVTK